MEGAVIIDQLQKIGLKSLKFNDNADLYIINTCTVTSKTDNEVLYWIRKAKKNNSRGKVLVTGCFAQVSQDILREMNEVDLVLGNTEKLNIAEYIKEFESEAKFFVSDIMQENKFKNAQFDISGKTRANIKIQDGCNNRCSYCIIPFARGNSRSDSLNNIISQVDNLVRNDYKELIFTGIHLGQWGLELKPKNNLTYLLKQVESSTLLERYRVGSLDPTEFSSDLIEFIFSSSRICNHFHISLQSATNKTLKNMNRTYSIEDYSNLVKLLSKNIPDLAIGSDVIVGFPGETDNDFEETYTNLARLPITYLHVFPYSIRKGTKAALLDNQIDNSIKKLRAEKLKKLAKNKKDEFIQSLIGSEQQTLIEINRDKESGKLKGLTSNYLNVLIDGNDNLMNNILPIKLIDIKNNIIIGKTI